MPELPDPIRERIPSRGMNDLVSLILRRHEGPGWQVFTELANGTGGRARRRADAVAMGMWPSRGYEIHGYECKISRGDVRKELTDVSKMDAVGKYCDFWWLAISDESIIDGLLIPASWGILVPRNRVLRAVRPAQKRKATPVDRPFVAAMLRSVTEHWVPRDKHREVIERQDQAIKDAVDRERGSGADESKRELEQLRGRVKTFEDASGVAIGAAWQLGDIGAAVQLVVQTMNRASADDLRRDLRRRAEMMEQAAETQASFAKSSRQQARALRDMIDELLPVKTELSAVATGTDD